MPAAWLTDSTVHAQQSIIVDIDVIRINDNQSAGIDQVNAVCDADLPQTSSLDSVLQPVCDELAQLDPDNAADAVRIGEIGDAIAIEEAFAITDALIEHADFQTTNVRARLDAIRQPLGSNAVANETTLSASSSPGLLGQTGMVSSRQSGRASGGGASSDLNARLGVFLNGHVAEGHGDGGTLQQDTIIQSGSVTLGGDYRFSRHVVAGVGIGAMQDESRFRQVAGSAETQGVSVSLFATWFEADEGYLDLVLDIGSTRHELARSFDVDPRQPLLLRSRPSASSTTLTIGGGRNFTPFDWDLGAYFRLSHTRATIDGFSESVLDPITPLTSLYEVDEQSVISTEMVFGVELSRALSTSMAVLVPMVRLEYVTENETDKEDIVASFDASDIAVRYQGEARVSSHSNLGLGTSAVFAGGWNAYAFYETHLQHDRISQNRFKLGLRRAF